MSYLAEFDAAAPDDRWPLAKGWMEREPSAFFRELRRDRPILVTPACTLVARHADVVECMSNAEVFTVELYRSKMGTYMLAQDDTPDHSRDKAIMQTMLSRDDLPRIRALIGEVTAEILAGARGRIEAVSRVTRRVPIELVIRYFGFSTADPKKLARWSYWSQYDSFYNHDFDRQRRSATIHRRSRKAAAEMAAYIGEEIAAKIAGIQKGEVRDDVVTRMLLTRYPPAIGFTPERLGLNVGGLLIGAVETTSQSVTGALAELLRRPRALAEAKQAALRGDLETFDRHVFEALRLRPLSPYLFRKSARDYTVAKGTARQTTIPAGTTVLALIASAMRDEDEFPLPEEFNIHRPLERTFHLGWGLHECLGKHIGMVMIPEIVRHFVLLDELRERAPIDCKGGPFPERWELEWSAGEA